MKMMRESEKDRDRDRERDGKKTTNATATATATPHASHPFATHSIYPMYARKLCVLRRYENCGGYSDFMH